MLFLCPFPCAYLRLGLYVFHIREYTLPLVLICLTNIIIIIDKVLDKNQRALLYEACQKLPRSFFLVPPLFGSLSTVLNTKQEAPYVFVLKFNGDIGASQVKGLTEEVTAILQYARPDRGDKVVVILNSGGGTVTGYGLGAAQLVRYVCQYLYMDI
jgi:hypothetical protein